MPMFAGCFIVRSWRLASSLTGSKSLLSSWPISILAWQLPRQLNIVLRFGWKERALAVALSGCLIGQGSGITRFWLIAFGGQVGPCLVVCFRKLVKNSSSFSSKSCVCGKHNKQFNSDLQRLALSLRVEFSVYGVVLKFSVCAAHTLIGRYVTREGITWNTYPNY